VWTVLIVCILLCVIYKIYDIYIYIMGAIYTTISQRKKNKTDSIISAFVLLGVDVWTVLFKFTKC
jgi:uncharacterized membrane protein YobD (UPF0266 family)